MSKVSRLVQAGFANRERKLKQRWERRMQANSEDRLSVLRKKPKHTKELRGSNG